jgi:uncharacterized protein (DUF39 family)
MISFMQKTIEQVNAEVNEGKTVIVAVAPAPHAAPEADQPAEVSAVTTATFANHLHCLPPPPSRPGQQK